MTDEEFLVLWKRLQAYCMKDSFPAMIAVAVMALSTNVEQLHRVAGISVEQNDSYASVNSAFNMADEQVGLILIERNANIMAQLRALQTLLKD